MLYSIYDPYCNKFPGYYIPLHDHRFGISIKAYGKLKDSVDSAELLTDSIQTFNALLDAGRKNMLVKQDDVAKDMNKAHTHPVTIFAWPGEHNTFEVIDVIGCVVRNDDVEAMHLAEMEFEQQRHRLDRIKRMMEKKGAS